MKPNNKIAQNAKKGLKLREEYERGGTRIGVTRAHQLARRDNLSDETIKRMYSFFKRHEHFKKYHKKTPPSNSYISWLLWGGDEAYKWVKKIRDEK